MAKTRVLKKDNSYFLQIPSELGEMGELEIYKLKDGFFVVSAPVEKIAKQIRERENKNSTIRITNLEANLIKKMLGIRFEKRTPDEVNKVLSDLEKQTLKELEKRGLIFIYKSTKYKDGVYNIIDRAYREVLEFEQRGIIYTPTQITEKKPPTVEIQKPIETPKPIQTPKQQPTTQAPTEALLKTRGYLSLNEKEAKEMAYRISAEMKGGKIVGIKSFDGKVHFVTRTYFDLIKDRIAKSLVEDMDLQTISSLVKTDSEGALAVLLLLAENGEIMERRKGIFAPL